MAQIEQAVFTSAETDRSAGYQVVTRSPGVTEDDVRDLSAWGPSHDSLLELGPDAVSINFHPLPSGAYCVSRTVPAGWEYSGRGGYRVYTHCLIVPPEVLARFSNNPFSLIRAVQASGKLDVYDRFPARMEPLSVAGGATAVDQSLLVRLAAKPGTKQMALLVQAAIDSQSLAVCGQPSAAALIAGLFSCLPIECRSEFSFSTGLKYSSRRPFRIVALSGHQTERHWITQRSNVTVLQLSLDQPAESVPLDGWARLIEQVLASGRTSLLATQLSKRRSQLGLEDLPALGLQFLEDLDVSALRKDHAQDSEPAAYLHLARQQGEEPFENGAEEEEATFDATPEGENPKDLQRAHAAHRRFERDSQAATLSGVKLDAPSRKLELDSPEALEKLERLDDVVYEAIGGLASAMDELKSLWPQVLESFGEPLVAESREQYLRYAISIWQENVDHGNVRNPTLAIQAIEVLCLLFNEPDEMPDS